MDVEPEYVKQVTRQLRAVGASSKRRARADGIYIYLEDKDRRWPARYLRLRRTPGRDWVLEEPGKSVRFPWVRRSKNTTLEQLLARWADPTLLYTDLRFVLPLALRRPPPPAAPKDVATIRRQLGERLAKHRDWLTRQLRARLSFKPPLKLRRILLAWGEAAAVTELRITSHATDSDGDSVDDLAPSFPARRLWPTDFGARLTSTPEYEQATIECIEQWMVDCYGAAAPRAPCPVYVTRLGHVDAGRSLATGRRATFRKS